jgi:hypothetical protein
MYYVLYMKMSIIKRVILTIAAAALFIVPVTIVSLQNNTTKTAEARYRSNNCYNYCGNVAQSDFNPPSHPGQPPVGCNSTCQGYYKAANPRPSYDPLGYGKHVPYIKPSQPIQQNYSEPKYYNPFPLTYNSTPNYNSYYSYNYSSNPEPITVNVPLPKQNYVDIIVPQPETSTYYSYNDISYEPNKYTDYSEPKYTDYSAYSVGNKVLNDHNSYEALTTDYVYSN